MIDTILCSQEGAMMERKGCWEVYGFDIMIDENYHPWLIEVNSSPACDYSTSVTEAFVKKALPDILKVVLDTGGCGNHQHSTDTGGWECIYTGDMRPKVTVGLGIDMSLKGEKISTRRHRKRMKRKSNQQDKVKSRGDLIFDDSDLSDYEQKNQSRSLELDKENNQNHHYRVRRQTKNNAHKVAVPLNKVTLGL